MEELWERFRKPTLKNACHTKRNCSRRGGAKKAKALKPIPALSWRTILAYCAGIGAIQGLFGIIGHQLAFYIGIRATQGLFGTIGPQLAYYTGMMCWHRDNLMSIWDHRASVGVLY